MKTGLLLVISGPSGVGKGTICRALLEKDPTIYLSISVTTRPPRAGEKDGRDYFFVSEQRFLEMVARGELLEWARVYSFYYGTPKAPVFEALAAGRDVLLEIDVQGGFKVRENYKDCVLIFLLPPSWEELEARLARRGTEDAQARQLRLDWAKQELSLYYRYDYAVVNERVEDTVAAIEAIRVAERCRSHRQHFSWLKTLLEG
ncbi:guanylate kinase [Ammonifex thiophilus]|uniref:Guanylate kinase n=1 Tax=Ammonifex thiophilus TaxID=444093 RepID=A0A3D8P3K7_9THEO|nr:guanylate kinase [Ammonifex thiophilus]RDV83448.1 guanylate kinase [Ammonifex thiophilus]